MVLVGYQHDQAGGDEARRSAPVGLEGRGDVGDPARGRDLEGDGQHGVGAEEPGEEHPRGVGLLHQPQGDDDVEQHLVGAQDSVEGAHQHEPAVAQRAPSRLPPLGDRELEPSSARMVRRSLVVAGRVREPGDPVGVDQEQRCGQQRHGVDQDVAVGRQRQAAGQGPEREADVACCAHVGQGAHPGVPRKDGETVGVAARPHPRPGELEGDRDRHEAGEVTDEEPAAEEDGLQQAAQDPRTPGADRIGSPPQRHREQEGDATADGQAEPDLRGGEPDDLGEVDRRAGQEGALAEGGEHRLVGHRADERVIRENAVGAGDATPRWNPPEKYLDIKIPTRQPRPGRPGGAVGRWYGRAQ